MTRKHFEALALALSATRPEYESHERKLWENIRDEIAEAVRPFNPNFDLQYFVEVTEELR